MIANKERNQEKMLMLIANEMENCKEKRPDLTDDINTMAKVFLEQSKKGTERTVEAQPNALMLVKRLLAGTNSCTKEDKDSGPSRRKRRWIKTKTMSSNIEEEYFRG